MINNDVEIQSHSEWANEQIDERRKRAYADALTGSDRLFAEAMRMKLMEEDNWEEKQTEAVARYEEIKQELPWV